MRTRIIFLSWVVLFTTSTYTAYSQSQDSVREGPSTILPKSSSASIPTRISTPTPSPASPIPTTVNPPAQEKPKPPEFQKGSAILEGKEKKRYVPTNLFVIRQVAFQTGEHLQKVDVKVPVLYRAGALYLNTTRMIHFLSLRRRITAHIKECELLAQRAKELQKEWDQLREESIPSTIFADNALKQ